MNFADKKFLEKMYKTIAEIESVSSVEVVIMPYQQSSGYLANTLSFSVVLAFLSSVYLMFAPREFNSWTIYLVILAVFIGSFALSNFLPALKRLLIPAKFRDKRPVIIAHSIFSQAELCNTKDRTAFFVFISQLEKKLVLIADKGIKEQVPQDELHEIQVKFDAVFRSSSPVDTFIETLQSTKQIFAKYLPVQPNDINELPDNLYYKIKL